MRAPALPPLGFALVAVANLGYFGLSFRGSGVGPFDVGVIVAAAGWLVAASGASAVSSPEGRKRVAAGFLAACAGSVVALSSFVSSFFPYGLGAAMITVALFQSLVSALGWVAKEDSASAARAAEIRLGLGVMCFASATFVVLNVSQGLPDWLAFSTIGTVGYAIAARTFAATPKRTPTGSVPHQAHTTN